MSTAENPHAGQGMVVLDIGGDIGALVVTTPPALAGVEIEVCPAGRRHLPPDEGVGWWDGDWRSHHHAEHDHDHDHADTHEHDHDNHDHHDHHEPAWPHVAVLERHIDGLAHHAAVFPGLREGTYDLWIRPDGGTALTATTVGGEVTQVAWPTDNAYARVRHVTTGVRVL